MHSVNKKKFNSAPGENTVRIYAHFLHVGTAENYVNRFSALKLATIFPTTEDNVVGKSKKKIRFVHSIPY
jgi:hypothetical protein